MALEHNCGIAAVYNPSEPMIKELYKLALPLQPRGFESAGIAVSLDGDIMIYSDAGPVRKVFSGIAKASFNSKAGIVHTRYSTTGISGRKNAQPIRVGKVALGHNGNLVNTEELYLMFPDHDFSTTTDSELIACIFNNSYDLKEGAERCYELCKGTYNLVLLNTQGEIGVFRDPSANNPLFAGYKGDSFYAASEDVALGHLDLEKMEEMKPGELIIVSDKGLDKSIIGRDAPKKRCPFEAVYFMRHGSTFKGKVNDDIRREIGRRLAKFYPVDADIVVPVLDSGISFAFGYSAESGIPIDNAIVRNDYVGRTYMVPEGKDEETPASLQMTRQELCKLKHIPIRQKIDGKRIVLTDDSIVRSNVSKAITKSLRKAGAKEIHWRIGFPPVRYPCFYGKDHAKRSELVAAPYEDPIEAGDYVAKEIGADSVRYILPTHLLDVVGDEGDICDACFTGKYWTEIPETQRFINALKL